MLVKNGEDHLDRTFEKEEVLRRIKEDRNILHTINRKKPNWMVICCVGTAI